MADANDPLGFRPIPMGGFEAAPDPEDQKPAKVLSGYEVHQQEQTQWCWAAVTQAIADYYGENDWSQCRIVNAERGRTDACDDPVPADANAPWYVWKALRRVGHYAEKKQSGKPPYEDARAEIDADRPLCVLIGWNGGGGHFVAVYGYDDDDKLLHVGDPWGGPAIVSYDAFPTYYEHGGSWNWSYWTVEKAPEPTDPATTTASQED